VNQHEVAVVIKGHFVVASFSGSRLGFRQSGVGLAKCLGDFSHVLGVRGHDRQGAEQSEFGGDGLDARVVRKALIIEDDRDFSRGLGRVLNQIGGHEVEIAPDGRTGIAVAAQFLPDVVLCDLRLIGEIDGYEVARIIKSLPNSQSPSLIVALTGFSGDREKKQAEDQGFDLYIT
jgi:CheY-like chemotaxis protein